MGGGGQAKSWVPSFARIMLLPTLVCRMRNATFPERLLEPAFLFVGLEATSSRAQGLLALSWRGHAWRFLGDHMEL